MSPKLDFFRQKPVFPAKIDHNHIDRAENRKMKTAELRPKRDKKDPLQLGPNIKSWWG